ncbi:hypothetical protein HNR78_000570 [Parageobacillus toebii NBRC 107807]|uniref:Uncharacterized protein n=1 Tax=Parageobacillus toebii NBRC 107807 TaxID=1223503 RepID=A0AA89NHX5_9BACL|nr:hypothetical protein [Parageobacillus toebii NBRC 107807]
MVSVNVWNADAYDEKLSFVSELGMAYGLRIINGFE